MQIGLKAERAAFTNAPLALSLALPSLASFRLLSTLAPLPLVSLRRSARAGLKVVLSLSDSCARLRRVTRAGKKKVHGPVYTLAVRDCENCANAGKNAVIGNATADRRA